MLRALGPILGGETLWRALGFSSAYSFRRACARGEIEVPMFRLPNRRGRYAYTAEVSRWLGEQSQRADQEKEGGMT